MQRGRDPTLALVAGAKLGERAGAAHDAAAAQHGAQQLLAAMASTEVYLAHAIAVLAVLRFGTDSQVQQALTHLRAQALDPSLNQRLGDALQTRRCTVA